jgi:colanic acid/amylovoran biosynthesis protein
MKIVISHAYSRGNKGDAALVSVLIEEVNREFGPDQLVILTMDKTVSGELFDGIPIESDFYYLACSRFQRKVPKLLYGAYMITLTIAWSCIVKIFNIRIWLPKELRQQMFHYADADLIIPVGGGYLRGSRRIDSIYNLTLNLHPILLSYILSKPTVLFSQSVGPFYHHLEVTLLRNVLNKSGALILVRENQSLEFLREIGVSNATRSVDAGFLFKGTKIDLRRRLGLEPDQFVVGVTARNWLDAPGQEAYQKALSETIDHLIQKYHAFVVLVPQVTASFLSDDDRIASRAIINDVERTDCVHLLEDSYDHHEIKGIYDNLNMMIGTRFHSVIFSLTSYVPAIAIEYEHKTSGIMSDLGLEKWVVRIEDVTAPLLIARVDSLMEQMEEYVSHLQATLPRYIDAARQAIALVRRAYEASLAR